MNKKITLICPKDSNKRYFSFKDHGYENCLNIFLNNKKIFSNINDAEELLPIEKIVYENLNKLNNEFNFEYNIKFKNSKENVNVYFLLKDFQCTTKIVRHNYVKGSENLDESYEVYFDVNGKLERLDKQYHQGDNKEICFSTELDQKSNFYFRWYSKKSFVTSSNTTYDDIILKVDNI